MSAIPKLRPQAPQISEEERARRKASIDNARASVRLEGIILSPEIEQINQQFINGELTRQEHVEAIKAVALHG